MSSHTNGKSNSLSDGISNKLQDWDCPYHDDEAESAPISNAALEAKLKTLKEQSTKHSQILTQKLASSQSGQNLLHMGSSLSTLPPDLHSMLQNLHPLLSATETYEKAQKSELDKILDIQASIRHQTQRCEQAAEAAEIYQDLVAAERTVQRDLQLQRYGSTGLAQNSNVVEEGNSDGEVDGKCKKLCRERENLCSLSFISTRMASSLIGDFS
jgi:hypothetical protein